MRAVLFSSLILAAPAMAQDIDLAKVTADAAIAAEACLAATGDDYAARPACVGETYQACFAAATFQNTIAQTDCAAGELAYWKAELNAAYDALHAALTRQDAEENNGVDQAPALEAAQKAWLDWRSAECDYHASFFGAGSGSGPAQVFCDMDLTGKRAIDLQAQVAGASR